MKYLIVSAKALVLDGGLVYHTGDVVEDPTNPEVLIRRGMAIPLPDAVQEAAPVVVGYPDPADLSTQAALDGQAESLSPLTEPAQLSLDGEVAEGEPETSEESVSGTDSDTTAADDDAPAAVVKKAGVGSSPAPAAAAPHKKKVG